jgi:lipoprotein-anchoring transpeptidase ErfK/SrfK
VLTIPVSTGKGVANATPPGSFQIFRKEVKSWSYPFPEWLPWASYSNGGIAFHEYPDVPTQAASHGCVRAGSTGGSYSTAFAPIGTAVRVLTRSIAVR